MSSYSRMGASQFWLRAIPLLTGLFWPASYRRKSCLVLARSVRSGRASVRSGRAFSFWPQGRHVCWGDWVVFFPLISLSPILVDGQILGLGVVSQHGVRDARIIHAISAESILGR